MSYVRSDMAGMACSEHVMRVVPDTGKIPSGYLYAYLSSKFGVPMVISATYGGIVQHIEPHHIADLPVPRFDSQFEQSVHDLIVRSALLREESTLELRRGEARLIEILGPPPTPKSQSMTGFTVKNTDLSRSKRLGAFEYNPIASGLDHWIQSHLNGYGTLGDMTEDVFEVPMFKHIYVQPGNGIPFFTSGNLFEIDRKPHKFLSPTTKNIDKYIIKEGWILIARHGQLGGIIGRPQYCDSRLHDTTTSDLVLRVIPNPKLATPGFLYCLFASKEYGYPLIVRHATGNSIPFINPGHLKTMLIPRVELSVQGELDKLVASAFEKRNQATLLEDQARKSIEQAIEAP